MPSSETSPVPTRMLADLRRALDTGEHDDTEAEWGLRSLSGARNNHAYAWTTPEDTPACVKLYRTDERRRAEREWAALQLLAAHEIHEVPAPLWLSLSSTRPAVAMTWVSGTPLLDAADRATALKGLAATTHRIHAVPLTGLLAGLDRVDSIGHYIQRLTDVWPDQLAAASDDPLTRHMQYLLDRWHASDDATLLSRPAPGVLSRGDANLLNWLTTDTGTACVDFEYAGRGDTATDAADLVEHISARTTDDAIWEELLPDLGITSANTPRFRAAQRTCALRWLAVLWKQRHRRTEEFTNQHQRVQEQLLHAKRAR
ncbi:aminoglycoside phosphotransferase family protein [Yinghuangia sp. ASG 101]|uniref:aminoglycoside phosphotransferase family protein n=1 Tax=Yinghuangia sp. ASG 101 TaxID=2896848 RepID=UPI001E337A01|nr:aminoglycoside phosphotransferase family protein [Yinghuangia sp. ASG 101]UGQ10491.1 aminoglycoside phosphotransferase family protein [Yinghuangia sp. ASG 101]